MNTTERRERIIAEIVGRTGIGIAGQHGVLLGRGERFRNDNLNDQAPSGTRASEGDFHV